MAVQPCRLADTRNPGAQWVAPTTLRVTVAGQCGVPAGATAAAITVTVTAPPTAGFAAAYPTGSERPEVSVVNYEVGQTRANGAIVALSPQGTIDVFASSAAILIVDVSGAFYPTGAAAAGRFVGVRPTRVVDTRISLDPLRIGQTRTIPLPAFVPQDATAIAVTVTIVGTSGAGWVTAFRPGTALPNASVVNADRPGQIRAAGFVASVTAAGFNLYSTVAANVIVDISGYFTGATAPIESQGLFVPVRPIRVIDTRRSSKRASLSSTTVDFGVSQASAVVANWTLTQTVEPGFVTAHSPAIDRPVASNVNNDGPAQTVANMSLTQTVAGTAVAFSSGTTHLLADLFGWFTSSSAPVNVAIVGDMVCAPGSTIGTRRCHHRQVSDTIFADKTLSALLALGDLQYENGELSAFNSEYEPTYGRLKSITWPVPGNHEYNIPGAAGYYSYFGARAGDPAKGYYSFELGSWHIVALNSNCSGGICSVGSAQERWLRADLAASTKPCTLAMWHHPRFSSGTVHGDNASLVGLFTALADFDVEMVMSGHEHDYERFALAGRSGRARCQRRAPVRGRNRRTKRGHL